MGIEKATLDEAARPPHNGFMAKIGGPRFLVAQLFTIVATILGVYLAGYVGFQRTLEYDRFTKAQQQASLLEALHAELKDNTTRLRKFVNTMDTTGAKRVYEWPRLRLFVWRAAGQTQAAFDVPGRALGGMQAYYDETGDMLTGERGHKLFSNSTGSYTYDRKKFKERLDAQVKTAETVLLPSLVKATAVATEMVKKYMSVDR